MKNKGFTLVELLAVIAILAVLVIVAMPNVLGMFNQAKASSFATEVQKLMDTAITTFTRDALLNNGKTVYYSSVDNPTLGTKKLDMSGNEKNYFIEMDRNGNFKRVVVYDANYCYDIYTTSGGATNGDTSGTKSKLINDKIEKTTVDVNDMWEAGSDSVNITLNGANYKVTGCQALVAVNKDNNSGGGGGTVVVNEFVKINGTDTEFTPEMTWDEWLNSSYNTNGFYIHRRYIGGYVVHKDNKSVCYSTPVYLDDGFVYYDYPVRMDDQIVKNENYV